MEPIDNKERLPEYLKVRFDKDDHAKYELLIPDALNTEDTLLYPMKEYFEDHYKENWNERVKLGRDTLMEISD